MTYLKAKYTKNGVGFSFSSITSKYYKFSLVLRLGKIEHTFHFWGI